MRAITHFLSSRPLLCSYVLTSWVHYAAVDMPKWLSRPDAANWEVIAAHVMATFFSPLMFAPWIGYTMYEAMVSTAAGCADGPDHTLCQVIFVGECAALYALLRWGLPLVLSVVAAESTQNLARRPSM